MIAYVYEPVGSAFQLSRVDRPSPTPEAGQVRIRVRACSLNYRDLVALRNKAGRKVGGRIPLSDGAGEVVALGPGVTGVQVGDRVAGCFFPTWLSGRFDLSCHKNDLGGTLDGMLAEEVILPATGIVPIPEHLSYEEAACLPCAGVTAWAALVTRGQLKSGETVLTLGTGGVSVFALQIATALGARVIATSSSNDKLQRARELGAVETINYREHVDWDKQVWHLTGQRGVDHVVEVGGPGTLGRSMQAVAASGHIALIGVLTGFGPPTESLFPLLARNVTLNGIYVGSREDFLAFNRFLTDHQVRPVIDSVYAFDQADAAFQHLESGGHFGKIVIRVGS